MSFGVLPTGFSRKPLATILSEIEADMVSLFGPGVIQTSQSPLGQINGLFANLGAQFWEVAEAVYQSYDPDQAEGIDLDRLARIRLLMRALGESDADLRQAITNAGRARIDLQDLLRAVRAISGVTYAQVFVNDSNAVDGDGLDPHSVAVAVLGGDDDEIAQTVRAYVVPGIGTSGNVRIDTNIDGVCRSVWLVRPTPVPVALDVVVNPQPDKMGCSPPSFAAIAAGLAADLAGDRRLINGQDVTEFAIRSAIECRYPNVEVISVLADYGSIGTGATIPLAIAFDEIATFAVADINVMVAP